MISVSKKGNYMAIFVVYMTVSDDDRIVSHDASRSGLYYHCVRDDIIYFTLSGWNHGVLSSFHACLNELPSELRGFAFKGTDLIYVHCVSNENFAITVKGFTRWSVEKYI